MTSDINQCKKCKKYTLDEDFCPYCDGETKSPHPARFSLEKEKKYSKYRLQLFEQDKNI